MSDLNFSFEIVVPDGRRVRIEQILKNRGIQGRVNEIGKQVFSCYRDEGIAEVTIVCVLTGGMIFAADLIRALKGDTNHSDSVVFHLELVKASNYPDDTEAQGVRTDYSLLDRGRIRKQHVLLVDDIIDTGETLQRVHSDLMAMEPLSLKTVALLQKKDRQPRDYPIRVDYLAFAETPGPHEFVVGYGMDWHGLFRHLSWIGVLYKNVPLV